MTTTMQTTNIGVAQSTGRVLSRRALLTLVAGGTATMLVAESSRAADATEQVTLYRDPGCGCCESYIAYLRRHGFNVIVKSASQGELDKMNRKIGIPSHLAGCHTAFVDGYVVDGLVPAAAVQKLLKDRPPLRAITLPGMPTGAPGMMGPKKEGTLTVYAIPNEGKPTAFMTF